MNFYQNTNSRAHHSNYDHRVYPTKVSQGGGGGPSSTSNKQSSILGTKPNGTKQHILVNNNSDVVGGLKLSTAAPAAQSAQYKTTYTVVHPSMAGANQYQNMDKKNIAAI
jgi:hypothetical protein